MLAAFVDVVMAYVGESSDFNSSFETSDLDSSPLFRSTPLLKRRRLYLTPQNICFVNDSPVPELLEDPVEVSKKIIEKITSCGIKTVGELGEKMVCVCEKCHSLLQDSDELNCFFAKCCEELWHMCAVKQKRLLPSAMMENIYKSWHSYITDDIILSAKVESLEKILDLEHLPCRVFLVRFLKEMLDYFIVKALPPVPTLSASSGEVYLEDNDIKVLRYIGGWIIKALMKRCSRYQSNKLYRTIHNILSNECIKRDGEKNDASDEWVKKCSRGKLIHVSDNFFNFLKSVELKTQKHTSDGMLKKKVLCSASKELMNCQEIQTYWEEVVSHVHSQTIKLRMFELVMKTFLNLRANALCSKHARSNVKKSTMDNKSLRNKLKLSI